MTGARRVRCFASGSIGVPVVDRIPGGVAGEVGVTAVVIYFRDLQWDLWSSRKEFNVSQIV